MLELLGKTGVVEGSRKVAGSSGYNLANRVVFKNGIPSVTFEIPTREFVTVKAYTLGGREIAELAGTDYSVGEHTIEFGSKLMSAGVVVLRMNAGSFSASRAIMVDAK